MTARKRVLTQFTAADMPAYRSAVSMAIDLPMHHPDVSVLHDVYLSIANGKPTYRSRRRFEKAASNIRELSSNP